MVSIGGTFMNCRSKEDHHFLSEYGFEGISSTDLSAIGTVSHGLTRRSNVIHQSGRTKPDFCIKLELNECPVFSSSNSLQSTTMSLLWPLHQPLWSRQELYYPNHTQLHRTCTARKAEIQNQPGFEER
jgi:hypothetical protein